jgi:hypothetical protein
MQFVLSRIRGLLRRPLYFILRTKSRLGIVELQWFEARTVYSTQENPTVLTCRRYKVRLLAAHERATMNPRRRRTHSSRISDGPTGAAQQDQADSVIDHLSRLLPSFSPSSFRHLHWDIFWTGQNVPCRPFASICGRKNCHTFVYVGWLQWIDAFSLRAILGSENSETGYSLKLAQICMKL